jgi:hypothetical protein
MINSDPYGHEAYVRRNFDSAHVEIWIVDRNREDRVMTTDGWRASGEPDTWQPPTLRLDPATAQNLWVKLTKELGLDAALPSADQRADYLHERERVDRLIGHLLGEGEG